MHFNFSTCNYFNNQLFNPRILPGVIFLFSCFLTSCGTYYFGPNKLVTKFNYDTIPPAIYSACNYEIADFDSIHPLVSYWAAQPLPEWNIHGKVSAARIMTAKLLQGRDVEEVNSYITSKKPWGKAGTHWILNPNGDYDFTETTLCHLLYLFDDRPDLLYPATKQHLVNILITHSGGKPHTRTPGIMGLMRETENHIFMGETSRYLKNQWLYENGDTSCYYDNKRNGLEKWLLNHLDEKFRSGFYEFNAQPYSGYTLCPLLTLYSFTSSEEMKKQCDKLLTRMIIEYSLSSLDLRRYPPFRRRLERERVKTFDEDPLSGALKIWLSLKPGNGVDAGQTLKHFAFSALTSTYRPNEALTNILLNKEECFVAFGHGVKSTPELYSGGKSYLLSSGGVQPGKISQIVAHPTVLFLKDKVNALDSCFYLAGKGKMQHWNNTGLYRNFACGPQPVHIPPQYKPVITSGSWQLFKPSNDSILILVYNQKDLGLLFVIPHPSMPAAEIIADMEKKNSEKNIYREAVTPENDIITYDVKAPKNRWVIVSVNSKPTDRKFNQWKKITLPE